MFDKGNEMALIECPECGRQVSSQAPACPHCGYPVTGTAQVLPPRSASSVPPAPQQNLVVKVTVARAIVTRTRPCPVQTVVVTFDGHDLGSTRGISDDLRPGRIHYVPGQHLVQLTVTCRGEDRRTYRIDHRVRLFLRELRRRDIAKLRVLIDFEGELKEVTIYPVEAGDIAVG